MQLFYESEVINDPTANLVSHLRDTVLNLEKTQDTRDFIIKMDGVLFSTLDSEMRPLYPKVFRGIKYVLDNDIDYGCYCIYRKDDNIPIKLTPVKTLNEWFTNLPLIYKIDLYNNCIKIIAENLK